MSPAPSCPCSLRASGHEPDNAARGGHPPGRRRGALRCAARRGQRGDRAAARPRAGPARLDRAGERGHLDLRARRPCHELAGRFHQFTPVWAEIESRIALEGTYPPSWFALLVIAGLIGAVGILTNSQILIVGAMVVGPEYGAILSLAFGVTRRDSSRVLAQRGRAGHRLRSRRRRRAAAGTDNPVGRSSAHGLLRGRPAGFRPDQYAKLVLFHRRRPSGGGGCRLAY